MVCGRPATLFALMAFVGGVGAAALTVTDPTVLQASTTYRMDNPVKAAPESEVCGQERIITAADCLAAAKELGLAVSNINNGPRVYNTAWGPPGCWAQSGTYLQFNEGAGTGKCNADFAQCICHINGPTLAPTAAPTIAASTVYRMDNPVKAKAESEVCGQDRIVTAADCLAAAQALALAVTNINNGPRVYNTAWGPPGCWAQSTDGKAHYLQFNEGAGTGKCNAGFAQCICHKSELAATAAPTTAPTDEPKPSDAPTEPPIDVYNIVEHNAPNVGSWGGSCTCPDGTIYQVGDNMDACRSLACVGGVSGKCGPWAHDGKDWLNSGAFTKVTCMPLSPAA